MPRARILEVVPLSRRDCAGHRYCPPCLGHESVETYTRARQALAIRVVCTIVILAKVQYEKCVKAAAELKYAYGTPQLILKCHNAATYDCYVRATAFAQLVAGASSPELVGPWGDIATPFAYVVAQSLPEVLGALQSGVGGTSKHPLNQCGESAAA